MKTTKDVVLNYYHAFSTGDGWANMLTEDVTFSSPNANINGIEGFVQLTKKFKQAVLSSEVKDIVTEGEKATVKANYQLALPTGDKLNLNVSEHVTVKNGKLNSFDIYFDTVALEEFMSKMPRQ